MNDDQSRRLAMLGRVNGFRERYTTDFAAATEGTRLMDLAATAEADATGGGADQSSGGGSARAGSATKADLYESLLDDLRAISATAKPLSKKIAGLDEKFRLPRSISQINIITAARAFLLDATPLAAEFVQYEMSVDFLTDLADDIAAYDKASDDQGDGLGKRVGATRTLAQAISDGCTAVRDADPLMRNKYKGQPAKLAEWIAASHVERAPRAAKAVLPAA